jgi:hypothetical protein
MNAPGAPGDPPLRPCSLSDALRALGFWLQPGGVRELWLEVTSEGIGVCTIVEPEHRVYQWSELAAQSQAQARHRRRRAGTRPEPRTQLSWSGLLRTVGQLLDAQGVRECQIEATLTAPGPALDYHVLVTAGGRVVLDTRAVRLELIRSYTQYIEAQPQWDGGRRGLT